MAMNRPQLREGLVRLALGGVMCMAGGLATTAAVMGAARSRIQQWDEPPIAKARRRYAQGRSAAVACTDGWRQNSHQVARDLVGAGGS